MGWGIVSTALPPDIIPAALANASSILLILSFPKGGGCLKISFRLRHCDNFKNLMHVFVHFDFQNHHFPCRNDF
jgi:hypothetical protein